MQKIIVLTATLLSFHLAAFGSENQVQSIDSCILAAIDSRYFPGAQLVVGNSEGVLYSNSYGYMDYSKRSKVSSETLYDLASCTKIFATTLAVMTLVDSGTLSLEAPLGELLELNDTLKFRDVKLKELLYHTSGFLPGVPIGSSLVSPTKGDSPVLSRRKSSTNPYLYDTYYYAAKDITYDSIYISHHKSKQNIKVAKHLFVQSSYQVKLDSMIMAAYRPDQRGLHRYSDLNFYLLQKIIERATDMPLNWYTQTIYRKMRLNNIGYKPLTWAEKERICPTEYEVLFRRDTIHGIVHDELAAVLGGVGGNAGLFAAAPTLGKICGMFLRGGLDYNDRQIVNPTTIELFTAAERSTRSKSVYALGFTKLDSEKLPYEIESYGHSGYTGTFFWIDPTKDLYVVLLTNRVHPSRTNKQFNPEYRAQLWEIITECYKCELRF